MMDHPFQIARWALLASFAVMVFVVAFPNPSPGPAWIIAEKNRYEQRFPELRKPSEPTMPSPTQLANRPEPVPGASAETNAEPAETPFRTAQLPARLESRDDLPRGARIQEPIFFEEEPAAESPRVPDPVHLDTPSDSSLP